MTQGTETKVREGNSRNSLLPVSPSAHAAGGTRLAPGQGACGEPGAVPSTWRTQAHQVSCRSYGVLPVITPVLSEEGHGAERLRGFPKSHSRMHLRRVRNVAGLTWKSPCVTRPWEPRVCRSRRTRCERGRARTGGKRFPQPERKPHDRQWCRMTLGRRTRAPGRMGPTGESAPSCSPGATATFQAGDKHGRSLGPR